MSLFFPPDGRVPGRDSPRPTWNPPHEPVPPRQPEHDVPVRIVAEYVLASSGRVYSRDVEPSESDSEFEREIPIEVGAAAMYSDYGTLVLTDLRLVFVNDFCASSVLSIPLAAIRSCAIAPTERLIREPKNVLVIQVHGSRFQFRFHRRDEDEPGITRFSDFIRLRLSVQTGRETNLPRSPTLQIDVTEGAATEVKATGGEAYLWSSVGLNEWHWLIHCAAKPPTETVTFVAIEADGFTLLVSPELLRFDGLKLRRGRIGGLVAELDGAVASTDPAADEVVAESGDSVTERSEADIAPEITFGRSAVDYIQCEGGELYLWSESFGRGFQTVKVSVSRPDIEDIFESHTLDAGVTAWVTADVLDSGGLHVTKRRLRSGLAVRTSFGTRVGAIGGLQ